MGRRRRGRGRMCAAVGPSGAASESPPKSGSADAPDAAVHALVAALQALGPVYAVDADSVSFLDAPEAYLRALVDGLDQSTSRAALASLYIGAEDPPCAAEDALHAALGRAAARGVALRTLMDCMRGTRPHGGTSAAAALQRLLDAHPSSNFESRLYMAPALHAGLGWRRALVPARVNEAFGLCHMKFAVFDGDVLVSGANMSRPYFADRADRYVLVRGCAPLADFFWGLLGALGPLCHRQVPQSAHPLPPEVPFSAAQEVVEAFLRHAACDALRTTSGQVFSRCAYVAPSVQMAQLGVRHEEAVLGALMDWAGAHMGGAAAALASGYLNVDADACALLRRAPGLRWRVVTAAPEASGFCGAPGFAGRIPAMYRSLAGAFLRAPGRPALALDAGREVLWEWARPAWTFHAKGLWLLSNPGNHPSPARLAATAVGSSNYGQRSLHRDLEAQVLVFGADAALAARMAGDMARVFAHASPRGADDLAEGVGRVNAALAHLLRSYL